MRMNKLLCRYLTTIVALILLPLVVIVELFDPSEYSP